MAAEEPTTATNAQDQDRRRLAWLPWAALAAVLLIVAWLLSMYADFGQKPTSTAEKPTAVRSVVVPDVVGFDRARAVEQLEEAGLNVTQETSYDAVAEPGTVASQEPAGGKKVTLGSEVVIGVAAENVGSGVTDEDFGPKAPDVIGMSEAGARDLLERGGYEIEVTFVYSSTEPQGIVYDQSPHAGEPAAAGSVIQVWISKGEQASALVAVPKVTGLTEVAAISKIRAAGLTPRPNYQPNQYQIGKVYEQQPAPGTKVVPERFVFILVGSMQ